MKRMACCPLGMVAANAAKVKQWSDPRNWSGAGTFLFPELQQNGLASMDPAIF